MERGEFLNTKSETLSMSLSKDPGLRPMPRFIFLLAQRFDRLGRHSTTCGPPMLRWFDRLTMLSMLTILSTLSSSKGPVNRFKLGTKAPQTRIAF
jgi:hypothetical protein